MKISHRTTANAKQSVSHNAAISKQVLLTHSDISNIVYFSRATFPAGEKVEAHTHADMTEVFYVEAGQAKFIINKQAYIATTGSCVTIEPNELHEVHNMNQEELILVYFGVLTTPA